MLERNKSNGALPLPIEPILHAPPSKYGNRERTDRNENYLVDAKVEPPIAYPWRFEIVSNFFALLIAEVVVVISFSCHVLLSWEASAACSSYFPHQKYNERWKISFISVLLANEELQFQGEVVETMPNAQFKVKLENGLVVDATISGRMRKHHIHVLIGDTVKVELSRYEPSKGRIIFRAR